jgi:hypothetical protein
MSRTILRSVSAFVVFGCLAPAAAALDPDSPAVKRAVAGGVEFLKKAQGAGGAWNGNYTAGATALAGLTLLECGVPANDPAVLRAAQAVRATTPGMGDGHSTYTLSLAIMFLDRLRDPADEPAIKLMALRLLAGQTAAGGWTYGCPAVGEAEMRRLLADKVKDGAPSKLQPQAGPANLPKAIQDQLRLMNNQMAAPMGGLGGGGDNSNTQFATLALWVAGRHDVPVGDALAKVEARFRLSQNADGGWSYMPGMGGAIGPGMGGGSSATMTCAGLLGLAVGQGVRVKAAESLKGKDADERPRDPVRDDPNIRLGLLALSTAVGQPIGRVVPAAALSPVLNHHYAYYYFWSLERVAVAYGLRTLGNKDWYTWGAEILVAAQVQAGPLAGSWQGANPLAGLGVGQGNAVSPVETCFALLFLRRANLAADLTSKLRGRVKDPVEVALRSGGVGGKGVKRIRDLAISTQAPERDRRGPAVGGEAARLANALVSAPAARQEQLVSKYQESKGGVYTQALAAAIRQLDGPAKAKARDALAERLVRMTSPTLREKLKDDDPEVRGAAALACGMKRELHHVPDLIPLLKDPQRRVMRAAHLALKTLTDKDFGPGRDATPADGEKAMAAWTAWWKKHSGR